MLKKQLFFIGLFFLSGFVWAAWRHQFFYLIIPSLFGSSVVESTLQKKSQQQKKVLFYVPSNDLKKPFVSHQLLIAWDEASIEKNMKHIVEKWLFLQQEAHVIKKHLTCNGLSFHQKTGTLFVSFSHSFLKKKWPLYFSWNLLKSLMQTLLKEMPQIQKVSFLINYQVWEYPYFDFSQPLSRTLF